MSGALEININNLSDAASWLSGNRESQKRGEEKSRDITGKTGEDSIRKAKREVSRSKTRVTV